MRLLILFILLSGVTNAQMRGKIQSSQNKVAVSGADICNVTQNKCVKSDANGDFLIDASENDKIIIFHPAFHPKEIILSAQNVASIFAEALDPISDAKNAPLAPNSTWIGAKIGYNFDGFSDDENDFIGAAKVRLNMAETKFENFDFGVIGNVSDFISNSSKEEKETSLQKLTLSVSGLSVGIYGQHFITRKDEKDAKVRTSSSVYYTANYRLNTYQNIGVDSITVNLSQFKSSFGYQFEGLNFTKKGSLNISVEGSFYAFDPGRYEKIFNNRKGTMFSLEIGAILPINEMIGFFVSTTMAPKVEGVFLCGLIVKPE
ncbi:MAG: hypothetical protein J0M30_02445 [Chitinophagales bacterium]|nr:hypothetical protein [Chitinophagales bacterium]